MNESFNSDCNETIAAGLLASIVWNPDFSDEIDGSPSPFRDRPSPAMISQMASEHVSQMNPPPPALLLPLVRLVWMLWLSARFANTEYGRYDAVENAIKALLEVSQEGLRAQLLRAQWSESSPALRKLYRDVVAQQTDAMSVNSILDQLESELPAEGGFLSPEREFTTETDQDGSQQIAHDALTLCDESMRLQVRRASDLRQERDLVPTGGIARTGATHTQGYYDRRRWAIGTAIAATVFGAFLMARLWPTLFREQKGARDQQRLVASNEYHRLMPIAGEGVTVPGVEPVKAAAQVIFCDDQFQYERRFQTDFKYASLVVSDGKEARFVQVFANEAGLITVRHARSRGRLDARSYFKYFVIIFANERLLGNKIGPLHWPKSEIDKLQDIAGRQDDPSGEKVLAEIEKILDGTSLKHKIGLFAEYCVHDETMRKK